jgi:hypothetical protein
MKSNKILFLALNLINNSKYCLALPIGSGFRKSGVLLLHSFNCDILALLWNGVEAARLSNTDPSLGNFFGEGCCVCGVIV